MANEISATLSINIVNGKLLENIAEFFQANQSNAFGPLPGFQKIGTTHEQIVLTDLGTPGIGLFKNLDTVNFVELGLVVAGTFYPLIKIKPGEYAFFRLSPSVALYAKANTAEVAIQAKVFSD
ncbi:MAG: hypothetical protein KatS3mg087_1183 [Patescibacteria group bacterium]|nr:MAG: hypothetical protein KatS3mg087_1183 [Patescibacteria group bacterium]